MQKNNIPTFDNTQIAFQHKSNSALRKTYHLFSLMNRQWLVNFGTSFAQWALSWRLPITPILRRTIYQQFCGGATIAETQKSVGELQKHKVQSFLDYGVEAKKTEQDFDITVAELIRSIQHAKAHPEIPAVSSKITGLARFALLEKIHGQGTEKLSSLEMEEWKRVKNRLHKICSVAQQSDTAIYFDAEESWIQRALDQLITEMMATYNKKNPVVYNTIQLYRHDRLVFLKQAHQQSKQEGYLLAAKLVRGAYMEKERIRAAENNYPSPIQPTKAATDRDFDAALTYCVENINDIAFCCASHNEKSALHLCHLMQKNQIPPSHPHVYFAQLYGMSNHISFNLAAHGYNVGKYMVYGPVRDVVPYLIRRAQENTSVSGQMSRELTLLYKEMKRRKLIHL